MPGIVQRFARDVSYSFISLSISALCHFVLRIFLSRYLGAADLGLYTLAFTVYSIGMLLSAFGVDSAVSKYTAQYRDDLRKRTHLLSCGSFTSVIIGCLFGLVIYFGAHPIADMFFDMPELENLLRILAIVFPFIALEKVTMGFLRGLRRMKLYALLNITQNVMVIILTVTLVTYGKDIIGDLWALVLPVIAVSLVSLFLVRGSLGKMTAGTYSATIRMLFLFGFYVVLANGIGMIHNYTDSLMIGYFLHEADVGIYATAITLSQVLRMPSHAFQMVTGPTIAGYWGKGETRSIENLANRVMKYTAAFIIPVSFLVIFLAGDIITLIFGVEFADAALPLQLLMLGAVFGAIQASIGGILSSTAYVHVVFRLSGIAVVINIILNWILIPQLGIVGAAIATSTTMAFNVLMHLYFTKRLLKIKIHWGWFGSYFLVALVFILATFGFKQVANEYIAVFSCLILLMAVTLRFFITKEDIRLIRQIWH